MALAMIFFPLLMALLAVAVRSNPLRPWLLPLTGAVHLGATLLVLARPDLQSTTRELVLDPVAKIVLLVCSLLFLLCSVSAVGYLQDREERSNRVFCASLLATLGIMSLVTWSHHLGLMWVAVEAVSLVTAPLIFFNRTPRSLEATWKYLIISSVGIALALLGTFCLAYSALLGGCDSKLTFETLLGSAPQLSKPWLRASFILLLVGYGTKMGLAPMHTWKPEAYGESPGVVGALFAGGITSCGFLAITRIYQICTAAGEAAFLSPLLLFTGLFSMAVAGIFMVGQRDFKRMLAYSSVEHMGILAIGLGIGGVALFGTLLHLITNGLTKGVLFLAAGNIHRAYGSKNTDQVRGALRWVPCSATLFLLGFLAITGSPPFGPFVSEFWILTSALEVQRFGLAGGYLMLLLLAFVGMAGTVLLVVQGRVPRGARRTPYRERWLTVGPIVVLMGLVLWLGCSIPAPLGDLLRGAVGFLEGRL